MDFCLLSKFDDLFSDIFLDSQFLWFDTIKLNNDHRRPRIRSDKVLKIIQDKVMATGKTNEAVKELLRMDYFKHYLATKSTKQQQEFIQHMKRYLYMYMPNAGFEIADTRRYGGAGRHVEACVSVTKDWKTGDEMRLCTGIIAHMEPHQEHELKKGNRDISVMWSTRKQCNCLFLGPARFVNHDCDPNAKFISLGPNSVTFKIIKDINCGDELTAFYGKHYFGENNCECRCATCETKRTGYFASEHDDGESTGTEKDEDIGYRRSSRKRKSTLHNNREVERLNRKKRASSEIARMHHIELEQLIGVLDNNNKDEDADITDTDNYTNQDAYDSPPLIKQEPQDHNDISTNDERPKVMSIDFLCSGNDNQQSSFSHSPLDLLCNAVLDAEYLNVRPKQEDITVVVSPNIHRDATDRVMRNHYDQQQQQQQWRDDEDSTSDTKADSAVGLSPDQDIYQLKPTPPPSTNTIEKITDSNIATTPTKKETSSSSTNTKTAQWQDPLFDDEPLSDLDDFMDDVSDLSSICSSDSDLESISSNENLGHLSTPSPSPVSTNKKEPTNKQKQPDNSKSKSDLDCVACGRTLNSETISDPSAVDLAVANELATWTWSPSAAFTDWRPQRCPRCERHVRVFNQEWPSRKIKKRPTSSNDSTKPTSTTSTTTTSVNRRSNTKKKSTLSNQYITKPTRKQYIRSPPTPTSEIFNGVEDLF